MLPVIPQLVMPLKEALKASDPGVVATALGTLQLLVRSVPRAGQALLPYYRQLLPPLNRWVGPGWGQGLECRVVSAEDMSRQLQLVTAQRLPGRPLLLTYATLLMLLLLPQARGREPEHRRRH